MWGRTSTSRHPLSSSPQTLPLILATWRCSREACFLFLARRLVTLSDLKFNDLIIPGAKFWYLSLLCFFLLRSGIPASFSWRKCHTNHLSAGSPSPVLWVVISAASSFLALTEHWGATHGAKPVMGIIPFNLHSPVIKWVIPFSGEKMYFKSPILSSGFYVISLKLAMCFHYLQGQFFILQF